MAGFAQANEVCLLVCVARGSCRVSPQRATHFLLLRQEKVSKEKASRIRRPAARAHCDARRSRGRAKLASLKQTPALIRLRLRFSSPNNGAGRTAKLPTSEYQKPLPQCTSTRLLNFGSLNFGLLVLRTSPCGRAEQRSGGRIRAGVCLSPQGEFSPTPLDASSARSSAAALTSARLLLLTFLGEARKVSALSGAYPDNAPLASATPETAPFTC